MEPGNEIMAPDVERDVYERTNLTGNQLLVWFGQKLHPEEPLYNVALTFTLSGRIDRVHFQKAFQALVNASDALRTVIEESDGVPRQRVLEELPFEMEFLDFSAAPDAEAAFENWLRPRAAAVFDFGARLFDAALAKLADERFVWYVNLHHIITDGWSVALVYRYVSEFYGRSLVGRLDEVAAWPRFQDYVRRERDERASPRRRAAQAYWKKKLAVKPEPLSFYGAARPRRTAEAERMPCDLGVERTQKLKALAARREIAGATEAAALFHVLAAVLFAYLHRVSGNLQLSIGVPFHNRGTGELKDTLGLIMEVLPLQIAVEAGDTFLSLIQKIRDEMSELRPFREVALPNRPHDKSYDVLLNYHITTFAEFHGAPVRMRWLHIGPENEALALQAHDFYGSGSLVLDFDFHCDVFTETEGRQAMGHFLRLLDASIDNPEGSLGGVSLLSEEERRRLLIDWNDTRRNYPARACVHELFEAQVERTPDAAAVVFEDRSLSYRELNRRANRLARYLRKLGAGPETLIAISMERSLEMVVGLLAILKAGGAYLPVDPAYPAERAAFMIADAGARVLLTHGQFAEGLSAPGLRAVNLDDERDAIGRESEDNPLSGVRPDNPAYVIYTSGSTGTPKGVVVCHRSVCNHLFWRREYFPLTPADRLLQKASFSFDDSVWEFFEPLMAGARLVMARGDRHQDCAYLRRLIVEQRITAVCLIPAVLRVFLDEPGIEECDSLRRVTTGGETLPVDLQERFFQRLNAELHNGYGPTEATIGSTFWTCRPGSDRTVVPIGRPIANTEVYILDGDMQPVPVGVAGELYIGGAGLARGYLNRPALTAEKFIPDPFSAEPGARLYKTGDRARYLADGDIEFLGRIDDQVKIRGYRIEPGEIEAALCRHPAVREAVVVAREAVGEKRLTAYVACDRAAASVSELRAFLKAKLPDYMIPRDFISLDALPRTLHGKVDRLALPAPAGFAGGAGFVEPRDEIERTLAKIWSQVLRVERVGVGDNFFDLGGHSLLATQIISRVRDAFRIEIALRTLFDAPTIAGVARAIVKAKNSGAVSPAAKVLPVSRRSDSTKPPL